MKITHRNKGVYSYNGIPVHCCFGVHEYVSEKVRHLIHRGAKVIELGAGSGALTTRLMQLGYADVRAIDLSRHGWAAEGAEVTEMDLNGASWGREMRGQADLVLAVEVIEHLENPSQFLRQCSECLRSGGTLMLTTPNLVSVPTLFSALRNGENLFFGAGDYSASGHRSPILPSMLEGMANEAGLCMLELDTCGELSPLPSWKRVTFWLGGLLRRRNIRHLNQPVLFARFSKS